MHWIKIEEKLPPKNTLVWAKRLPNKIEKEPIYLAMRNGSKMSKNADPSVNCHWYGINSNSLNVEHEFCTSLNLASNFSDITVIEWSFVDRPF
jgi:hypothetical protein